MHEDEKTTEETEEGDNSALGVENGSESEE